MTIMARYSGICPRCEERWQPGELIRAEATESGALPTWTHAACPLPSSPLEKRPGEVACQTCWLIHPEGECDR